MATMKLFQHTSRLTRSSLTRALTTTTPRTYASEAPTKPTNPFEHLNSRVQDTAKTYREFQLKKPLNPHMTNTTSTIANEFPSVGSDKPPPELVSAADGDFVPKDSIPENTQRMTGGTQDAKAKGGPNADLDVGEIEGGTFKVEPLRREGEDLNTLRARLLYQSRKRGTLESDLLLSTFANKNLGTMSAAQLRAYDIFLDENDWDIYYWATQEPTPTSLETAEGSGPGMATPMAQGKAMPASEVKAAQKPTKAASTPAPSSPFSPSAPPTTSSRSEPTLETDDWRQGRARSGEWAQTVGAFKPAYRPVPARWKNSEILSMLRKHVIDHSAGGVLPDEDGGAAKVEGEGLARAVKGVGGGGLGMMPELRSFRQ